MFAQIQQMQLVSFLEKLLQYYKCVFQSIKRKRKPSERELWWNTRKSCAQTPSPRQQRSKQRKNMHWSRWWRYDSMTHTTCTLHPDLAQMISSFTVYYPCDPAFKSKMTMKCFISHWKLESDERDTIQKMKDTEREKMTEELAAWQQRQKKQIQLKSREKNLSNAEASVVQQENKGSGGNKVKSFPVWTSILTTVVTCSTEISLHVKIKETQKQKARNNPEACFLQDLLATFRSHLLHVPFQQHSGNHGCMRKSRWDFYFLPPCSNVAIFRSYFQSSFPKNSGNSLERRVAVVALKRYDYIVLCITINITRQFASKCFNLIVRLLLQTTSGWSSKRKLSAQWMQMSQNWRTWRKRKGILNG